MKHAPLRFLPLIGSLALLMPAPSAAQPVAAPPSEAARVEARERFDRGLRLFNQQDNAGALAEFLRAQELAPHPLVLYNIGLVYGAMLRPVEAVAAFDSLLARPAGLDADKLERVREERTRQAASIAEVEVVTAVPGAIVELDGVEVGRTPLPAPLKLASGTRVIGLIASGFAPSRKSVTVAGQTRTRLEFELIPQAVELAHLRVVTRVPGAEVFVDGERVGKTPLPASLALSPGTHKVVLRRPGYAAVERSVDLGPGGDGQIALDPAVDPAALTQEGGDLALTISEPGAVVFIDGESRGPYTVPLRLPAGVHQLRIERGDFLPFERQVDVPRGRRLDVSVELEPTPAKRARYRSSNERQRTWGFIAVGAGTLIGLGGGGFLLWNQGQKNEAEDKFDSEAAKFREGGPCDPDMTQAETCRVSLELALQELDDVRARDVFGWVGLGVGAAAIGTGLVLILTSDDPDRYEPRPESDVFGKISLEPWLAPGIAGLGARATF